MTTFIYIIDMVVILDDSLNVSKIIRDSYKMNDIMFTIYELIKGF